MKGENLKSCKIMQIQRKYFTTHTMLGSATTLNLTHNLAARARDPVWRNHEALGKCRGNNPTLEQSGFVLYISSISA